MGVITRKKMKKDQYVLAPEKEISLLRYIKQQKESSGKLYDVCLIDINRPILILIFLDG